MESLTPVENRMQVCARSLDAQDRQPIAAPGETRWRRGASLPRMHAIMREFTQRQRGTQTRPSVLRMTARIRIGAWVAGYPRYDFQGSIVPGINRSPKAMTTTTTDT